MSKHVLGWKEIAADDYTAHGYEILVYDDKKVCVYKDTINTKITLSD